MNSPVSGFPFSAVVGLDGVKLALLLAAVDPRLGGVLLRGDKGSAKTTLARGLAAVLPGEAPFVELPIGATEDRVVGSIDLARALTTGETRFHPGLLAAADGGVLYVDEVNLLPDHLVDVLLDVAASGVNRVEREGVSHSHQSRFVLIGSMNPEEGDLRPQLLDRFGLAAEVRTSTAPAERAEAVRRRLAWERRALATDADSELRDRLAAAHPADLPERLIDAVSGLCVDVGAQGLRADLTICRAAAALAGWEGRPEATADDVRRVAPLALAHRARRDPLEPAGMEQQRLDDALDSRLLRPPDIDRGDEVADPAPPSNPLVGLQAIARPPSRPAPGRGATAPAGRGRQIGDRIPDGPVTSVALGATVRSAAARRAASGDGSPVGGSPLVAAEDLRQAVHIQRTARLVVLAIDASGSMGADQRMAAAKGAVLGLLVDAYQRRDLVGLVAFRGEEATVLLRPTGSVEVARARLAELPTGGRTPLAAGITAALDLAAAPARAATHRPLLVVVTDGRATAAPDGVDPRVAADDAAATVRRQQIPAVILDVEPAGGGPRLGLAARLAARMGATYVPLQQVTAGTVCQAVTAALA